MLLATIKAWPEFNLFTASFVMSRLPADSPRFQEGLEWQWRTLDECIDGKIDRANPDYAQYMALETKEGEKRACWNSWIAPHNFEGFFLNMGDMLVKAGDWQTAQTIGYYNFGEEAIAVGKLAPDERLARAVQEGGKIHPQYEDELEASFSVAWDYIPYSMGGWAAYSSETREGAYAVLNQPDDRFYLAGEHLSYLTGWMAGALESARTVVTGLHERVLQEAE